MKLFECANDLHATFIAQATQTFDVWFPTCRFVFGNLAVCDWIPGSSVNNHEIKRFQFGRNKTLVRYLTGAGDFLSIIHGQDLEGIVGFDYIDDFLLPQFRRCCEEMKLEELGEELLESASKIASHFDRKCFVHPDLTPANVVVDSFGAMKIIDNELFGCSAIPVLDELNLVNSLKDRSIKTHSHLVNKIIAGTRDLFERELQDELMNLWSLRKITSWHLQGNAEEIEVFSKRPLTTQRLSHALLDRLKFLLP